MKADYQTFVATNNISLSSTDLASVFDTEAKTDAYIELYIDRLEQSSKKVNTTDTSTTIGDLRALITKDTTASTVSDLEMPSPYLLITTSLHGDLTYTCLTL